MKLLPNSKHCRRNILFLLKLVSQTLFIIIIIMVYFGEQEKADLVQRIVVCKEPGLMSNDIQYIHNSCATHNDSSSTV